MGDERGFVMVMVVLLLFAVAVAGATGYQLVSVEADLASGAEESQTALAAARAGLERYVGEHIGVPGGTTTYVIADADVSVVPQRVVAYDSVAKADIYLIKAIAELADPRHPNAPARRTVHQYARLIKNPVHVTAALMSVAGTVVTIDTVRGTDTAPSGNTKGTVIDEWTGDCEGGSAPNVYSVAALSNTTTGSTANTTFGAGTTPFRAVYANAAAVLDSADLRWSVLKDAAFPVPHTGTWPTFSGVGAIPTDSFPVVRFTGDLTINSTYPPSSAQNGRGVLIVGGTLSINSGLASATWTWNGLILAGAVSNTLASGLFSNYHINGAVIAGLNLGAQTTLTTKGPFATHADINYQSCWVAQANRVLAYFQLIDGTRWEF